MSFTNDPEATTNDPRFKIHESIILYPDDRLRAKANTAENGDATAQEAIDLMLAARKPNTYAMAAPSVGYGLRVVMIPEKIASKPPIFMLNPEITELFGTEKSTQETNVSLHYLKFSDTDRTRFSPTIPAGSVKRFDKVRVTYTAPDGEVVENKMFNGPQAFQIQAMVEQLDGTLFIDKMDDDAKAKFYERHTVYKPE